MMKNSRKIMQNSLIFAMPRYLSTQDVTINSELTDIVSTFESFSGYPDVMEITQIMERIINTTLTVEEFNGYQPFLEEVAEVAIRNQDNLSNGSQALIYIRFFLEKGEFDKQTWLDLSKTIQRVLPNASTEIILDICEILKNNKKLDKNIGLAVAKELRGRLSTMDINDIPASTSIVCAYNQQNNHFIVDLEEGLLGSKSEDSIIPSENIMKLTSVNFSLL